MTDLPATSPLKSLFATLNPSRAPVRAICPRPALWDNLGIGGCMFWDHDVQHFADALTIVRPKSVLETGFFAGASAFFWLYLSNANLTSIDPMVNLHDPKVPHTGKPENVGKLQTTFPGRFTFLQKDSKLVRPDLAGQSFDLFFIDGDHWEAGIRNDFQLALDLNIPWILVDDFVTTVEDVYHREFAEHFVEVRHYDRHDTFQGRPIPIKLFRRRNDAIDTLTFQ